MIILQATNLTKEYDHRLVWSDLSFHVTQGERIGLIGANGCGKSTLLRILAKLDQPKSGEIHYTHPELRISYMGQEWESRLHGTALDTVLGGDPELARLRQEMREAEASLQDSSDQDALDRYYQLLSDYQSAQGYERELQAATLLKRMGLLSAEIELPMASLSGGQRTRVGLARVLFSAPDLLLLDEPTTHLDLDALEWLEQTLRQYQGTLIVVSHDRSFLDAVATRILELSDLKIASFPGNYSAYLQQKELQYQTQTAAYQKQQREIRGIQEAIRRQEVWFHRASNVKGSVQRSFNQDGFFLGKYADRASKHANGIRAKENRMRHIEEHRVEKPRSHRRLNMRLGEQGSLGRFLVRTRGLGMSYGDKMLFTDLDLTLEREEHVAIVGPNGCGKTTLLRILLGQEAPTAGTVECAGFSIGYFSQETETLSPELTVLEEIRSTGIGDLTTARTLAGSFLFRGEDVYKPVSVLSSGEKARLALAKLVAKSPDLLVLDEPTNHLDIPSRERVEDVLVAYSGTILLVSHDRYLLRKLATQVWRFSDRRITCYREGYDEYLTSIGKQTRLEQAPNLAQTEYQLSVAQMRLALISGQMADQKTQNDPEAMEQLRSEFMELSKEIETLRGAASGACRETKGHAKARAGV
ncbi:MAG: ribosomal protection-like ABC-F family protein [Bacillota bacterium]